MAHPMDHVRNAVKELNPYQPGKPIEEVQRELGLPRVAKLASNEYPEGPFPEVIEAIRKELEELHRYPDAAWFELREAITSVYDIRSDEVLFGNGANEILELIVHLCCGPGDEVLYAQPSFPIYMLLSQSHFNGGKAIALDKNQKHDLSAMASAIGENTRVVFICNPNNPTGTYVGESDFIRFMEDVPEDVLVVLDEAYAEFVVAKDYPDFFRLRQSYPNLLSVRSFSKVYSLAALRIGYAMGQSDVIGMLQRVRQPFNVNRLAQKAAAVALKLQDRVAERRVLNRRRLEALDSTLKEMGCTTLPSQTNFLLVKVPTGDCEIFDKLLKEGVIIRPMHRFGLGDGSFRVNVGDDAENEMFLDGLRRIL